ncbi:hypothetical protein [Embleya hyalina]|uniref:Uncharacterized protein n=1 Tax=Embleya hyalina TaxID=516124 RepID=A0A401YVQ4_9ACTN|nr:hypothetical protein [Embleya hyalina]GCD98646.1 hypothetical protein EHYA_06357 [Embleya hyalina]
MSTRPHHYRFAHVVFRSIALRNAAGLLAAPLDELNTRTADLWVGVGGELPEEQRLPADGLALSHVPLGAGTALLVRFPPALHPPEAHFALLLGPDVVGEPRYFVLEESLDMFTRARVTVLGAWNTDTHLNLGPGPAPEADAFVAAVEARLG